MGCVFKYRGPKSGNLHLNSKIFHSRCLKTFNSRTEYTLSERSNIYFTSSCRQGKDISSTEFLTKMSTFSWRWEDKSIPPRSLPQIITLACSFLTYTWMLQSGSLWPSTMSAICYKYRDLIEYPMYLFCCSGLFSVRKQRSPLNRTENK